MKKTLLLIHALSGAAMASSTLPVDEELGLAQSAVISHVQPARSYVRRAMPFLLTGAGACIAIALDGAKLYDPKIVSPNSYGWWVETSHLLWLSAAVSGTVNVYIDYCNRDKR